jgi:formylglycine-generating enzyme required for sulfatase activity
MGSTPEWIAQAIKNGADKAWVQNEAPQHTLELSEYSIGRHPITNREYQAFVLDANYNPPRGWDGDRFPTEKSGHPVASVSWNDATAYCKWLSEETNKPYRLPTEAEWEKAARGEEGLIYPWGDTFDSKNANTYEAKLDGTSEVGQFSPQGDSPFGCADMAGNVWEWTNSLFKSYPYRADDGREDMHSNEARVLRGGSFVNHHRYAHCASRHVVFNYDVGFRVCVSPIPKSEI